MKDYLNIVNDKYPIRRQEEQKSEFRKYIKEELKKSNFEVKEECLENKHTNILIGDVDNAKVVFCAHYDTPAASIFPNLMMPRNVVLGMCYQFSYPILLSLISLGIAFLFGGIFSLVYEVIAAIYVVLYLTSFYLLTRFFDNKHNKNDNTSGVAAILSLIENCQRNDVGFILFDNEEKGKLGSKAFSKAHKEFFESKLVINLDCVGTGKHILFVAKEEAEKLADYELLKNNVNNNDNYEVHFYPMKGSMSNSDYKNFNCGISVMACKKFKFGYYTPRIHTKYDIEADSRNIEFLTIELNNYINKL